MVYDYKQEYEGLPLEEINTSTYSTEKNALNCVFTTSTILLQNSKNLEYLHIKFYGKTIILKDLPNLKGLSIEYYVKLCTDSESESESKSENESESENDNSPKLKFINTPEIEFLELRNICNNQLPKFKLVHLILIDSFINNLQLNDTIEILEIDNSNTEYCLIPKKNFKALHIYNQDCAVYSKIEFI